MGSFFILANTITSQSKKAHSDKPMNDINFSHLHPKQPSIYHLWQDFYQHPALIALAHSLIDRYSDYDNSKRTWQMMNCNKGTDDTLLNSWLIDLFNGLYANAQPSIILTHSDGEPEYFAPTQTSPARIAFAHGFFNSGLHEISHWCVAGRERRLQDDFGYWYCPDGRDEIQQALFEQVEIKPQAIECLFNLALGRNFFVSLDNLNATFDTTRSTFAQDVYAKAYDFLCNPHTLPTDARRLLWVFLDTSGLVRTINTT